MPKEILVIKFGTSSITHKDGSLDLEVISKIAEEVSLIRPKFNIVLVSSGAVGGGKSSIKNYKGTIPQKKAAAAVGNLTLISEYNNYFNKYGCQVAQSLIEKHHFSDRTRFLELKETFEELWKSNIIPIANENDVVNSREIKFSDNDELATAIAAGFGAKTLLLCTKSGGLINKEGELVKQISQISKEHFEWVDSSLSSSGTGGMASKLTFAKIANTVGIDVIIFGMSKQGGILPALNREIGTYCSGSTINISIKNKWLASGPVTTAKVKIDNGAQQALAARKSLLSVGVVEVIGDFTKGEYIEILNTQAETVAIARCKIDAQELDKNMSQVVVHADDLVLL